MKRLSTVFVVSAISMMLGTPSINQGGGANKASASTIRLCNGSNFVGGWVGAEGAGGLSIFDIGFINEGHETCRLAGYPTIQGYKNGREYLLMTKHVTNHTFAISSTIVAPRMSGEMVITTSALCDALNTGSRTTIKKVIAKDTYTVGVKFPHSNDEIYIYGLSVDVACGLNITQLGWR